MRRSSGRPALRSTMAAVAVRRRNTFIEVQKVFSSDVLYKLRCDLAIVKKILTC